MDEQSIFLGALEKSNPDAVAQWLDAMCGADRELRQRIEAMLESHQQADGFLERPVDELLETALLATGGAPAVAEHPSVLRSIGKRFGKVKGVSLPDSDAKAEDPVVRPSSSVVPKSGIEDRYQFVGEIARGGMGAVIKGRDTDLGRDLAVKVLLDDHKHKPEMIQRFVEEAQIGGQLQHPGIAPVYELGELSDRRPFFTMKLVKGKTLAALLSERDSPEQDQAKLLGIFEQVCQTMAYAHSRSVIHRDLKPANIMVGAFGEVQVMDWGLAKVLQTGGIADETKAAQQSKNISVIETIRSSGSHTTEESSVGSQTRAGSVMGTPAYMPPEQAAGDAELLDARADVFGLGAILCEILTGQPPYVADDGRELLRMAARGDLEDCQQRLQHSSANAELVELARRCLTANPSKRLKDARVVADRVTEHLESVAQKLKQAEVRRKLTYVVAASLLLLVSGLGGGAVWLQAQESKAANQVAAAEQQRADEQEAANDQLQQALYASQVQLAGSHLEGGRIGIADRTLESLRPAEGMSDLRGFEWHYLKKLSLLPEDRGETGWADFARKFYSGAADGPKGRIEVSHDGGRVLCSRRDFKRTGAQYGVFSWKFAVYDARKMEVVWSHEDGPKSLREVGTGVKDVCMSLSGQKVATYANQGSSRSPEPVFVIVDLDSGKTTELPPLENSATWVVKQFRFSPNGKFLLANRLIQLGERRSTLAVWDIESREVLFEKEFPETFPPDGVAFSPDGSSVLTVDIDKGGDLVSTSMTLWNVLDGEEIRTFQLDPGQRPAVLLQSELGGFSAGQRRKAGLWSAPGRPTFSNDGSLIAMSGENAQQADRRAIWVWNVKSGERIFSREVNTRSYQRATFSADNKLILHHGGEVFRISNGQRLCTLGSFADSRMVDVKFSEGNGFVDGTTEEGEQYRWSTLRAESGLQQRGMYCVSPDASKLTHLNIDGSWWLTDHAGKRTRLQLPHELPLIITYESTTAISDDGRYLATIAAEVGRGRLRNDTPRVLTVWDTNDSSRHATLWKQDEDEELIAVRYVPVKGWLAGVVRKSEDGVPVTDQLIFWDVKTKQQLHTIDLPKTESIAFAPDGKSIAVEINETSDDDQLRTFLSIRDLDDRKERQRLSITPMKSDYVLSRVAFRPGTSEIAVMNPGRVDIWDLNSKSVRQSLSAVSGNEAFAWTADGARFITIREENEQGDAMLSVWHPGNGNCLLVQGIKCFIEPGNSLKTVPGTDKLFSWAGNIQYFDGTPRD